VCLFYKLSHKTLPFLAEMQLSTKKNLFWNRLAFFKKDKIEKKLGPLFGIWHAFLSPKQLSKFMGGFFWS
jgi:hypothetical protein